MIPLFQRIASRGPGRGGFGLEGGRVVETYISTAPVSRSEMQEALRAILGTVERSPLGQLNRQIPVSHPDFKWLFASDVQIIGQGHRDRDGNFGQTEDADEGIIYEAPSITTKSWRHVKTELQITFEPRPYTVLQNGSLQPTMLSYWNTDGSAGGGIDSQEYLRYVDEDSEANPQLASFTHGEFVLRTGSGSEPGGSGSGRPAAFPGTPWVLMPNGTFRVVWYAVPYSIYRDKTAPMWRYISHVNQQSFWGWEPGKLLYKGPSARKYTPTFPFYAQIGSGLGGTIGGGTTAFSSEKLCDIAFNFEFTMREVTDPPDLAVVNGSWIPGGHNAMPWHKTRLFYTVTTPSSNNSLANSEWRPLYPSAPMHLLFTCPAPPAP